MDVFLKILGVIIAEVLFLVGMAFLFGLPTMWLWNWLMPAIFGLTKISIYQAVGLNILCGVLFRAELKSSSKNDRKG